MSVVREVWRLLGALLGGAIVGLVTGAVVFWGVQFLVGALACNGGYGYCGDEPLLVGPSLVGAALVGVPIALGTAYKLLTEDMTG